MSGSVADQLGEELLSAYLAVRDMPATEANSFLRGVAHLMVERGWTNTTEGVSGAYLVKGKIEQIQKIVDKHFADDPYHAGRVAHQLNVDSALNSMSRIRKILEGK